MYDVVARIAGVTSVKAHTKLVIMTHSIIDSRKLLKVSSNLTALSRHYIFVSLSVANAVCMDVKY